MRRYAGRLPLPPRGLGWLWWQGVRRRPARTLPVLLLAVVLSATTSASLVAADSLAHLFAQDAAAEWGAVDVEAVSASTTVFEDTAARALGQEAGDLSPRWAPRLLLGGVTLAGDRTEPRTQVLGLGAEDQAFPLRAVAGSVEWLRLDADQAVVNARLARRLALSVGSPIVLVVAVPEWREQLDHPVRTIRHLAQRVRLPLTVAGIAADLGTADLHRASTVILTRDVLQRRTGLQPARSTVLDFTARSSRKADAQALVDHLDATALQNGLTLRTVRADALATADGEGGLFRSILLTLAVLVSVAAAAALVNLLTALGLDRGRELAVLRALGVRRAVAGRLLVAESVGYAAVAVVAGTLLAMPLSTVLGHALADHFAGLAAGRGREQVHLSTSASPVTLLVGALVVLAVVGLTGRAAARRVLMTDPDLVLRGETAPAPGPAGGRRPTVALVAGSLCLGAAAAPAARGTLVFLGLTLLGGAWWLAARRRVAAGGRVRLDRWAAWATLAWAFLGAGLLGDFRDGVQAGFGTITVAGLLAIGGACVVLADHYRAVALRVRSLLPGGVPQAALLSAGANAAQHRDRSALATGTVAAALFTVAALAVLGNAAGVPATRQGGGFDVVGTSLADMGADQLGGLPGVADVVGMQSALQPEDRFRVEDDGGRRMTVPYPVRLVALDSHFVLTQRFGLAAALPAYRTAGEALQAALTDDDKVVLDRYARPEGARPGDHVVLDTPSGPRRFRLVAVLDTFLLDGAFVSERSFRDASTPTGDTLLLARAAAGSTPARLAATLDAAARESGLDARTVARARRDVIAVNRTFTDVFALLVGLALVVSLVSTAAGVVRAGRERRGELAVFRALGASRGHAVLVLAAEPVLTVALGATVGLGVGLLLLRVLFAVGYSDLPFLIDAPLLLGTVVAVVAVTALTCALAAWPATRRSPGDDLADLG